MARKETYKEWKARVHPDGGPSSGVLQNLGRSGNSNSSGTETYEEWRARVHPEYDQANALGNSFNSFVSGTQKLAEQIGINDFRNAASDYSTLLEQRNYLDDYFSKNPTAIDASTYRDCRDFLSLFDELGASVQNHQDMLSFDFDSNQAEVESLTRILNEYDILSRTMTDERGTARLAELQNSHKRRIHSALYQLFV